MEQILDQPNAESQPVKYAGFWIRFVAALVDGIIVGIVLGAINAIFFGAMIPADFSTTDPAVNPINPGYIGGFYLINIIVYWLYFALMESSEKQATLGKMVVGVKVIDSNGERLTFGRATGRYFGKILSALILYIGYIMAGFDSRKQALHDKLADTFVVYGR